MDSSTADRDPLEILADDFLELIVAANRRRFTSTSKSIQIWPTRSEICSLHCN